MPRRSLLLLLIPAIAQGAPAPERLTLRDAINRALTSNPQVLVQIEELHRAEAQLRQVRAGSLPTLTGNGLYTRLDHDRVLPGSPATDTMPAQPETILVAADAASANVTASVPLVAPQRWVQWSQARGTVKLAGMSVADVKRQVAIAVASTYLTIISRRREVELNEVALHTAEAHAAFTKTRLEGGVGSRLDDVRAQQERETNATRVTAARLLLARSQETLGVLVAAEGPADASEEPWFGTPEAAVAAEEAPKLRVDLRLRDERRLFAERVVHDNYADYLPTLTANFLPIYTWPGTIFTPTLSWQFQLVLTVPLYDGGRRYGWSHERRALLREAQLDQEGALRQTRSDVRIGDEAVRRTTEALERAKKAADLAHEAVQIADLAYRAGATTNLELIDAERRARDADTAAAIAEDAARQARVDLLFAAGRLP